MFLVQLTAAGAQVFLINTCQGVFLLNTTASCSVPFKVFQIDPCQGVFYCDHHQLQNHVLGFLTYSCMSGELFLYCKLHHDLQNHVLGFANFCVSG